jgi:paraquat-inducible protein B
MNATGPPDGFDAVPEAVESRVPRMRLPLVWLVPLLAACIGGWIAVRAVLDHGPTITITFSDAEGIEAGKTKVRYKSVDVGTVKLITLSADHRTVILSVEMAKFAAPFLVADTRFWVVRPRLGATGVSGLGTLLSGAVIGMDVGSGQDPAREFAGLAVPPVVAGDTPGREFILEAEDVGSLGVGAPAYFHHIEVGQISAVALDPDGNGVTLKLFVQSPYDRFVTESSRFWHASGVDVAVDSGGVHVQTESVATILAGGVAFESPGNAPPSPPSPGDAHFRLAANREAAMKTPDRIVEPYILYFEESLRGLAPGAVLDFRGVEVGEVTSLKIQYDRAHDKFLFPVLVNVYPERIRSRYREGGEPPLQDSHALVARMIEHGFRAQLRTASLLTGQLYVALDFFPKSAAVAPQPALTPMPLPTIPGNFEELQNTIVSVANKLDQLPIEKIGRNLQQALVAANAAAGGASALIGKADRELLPEAQATLAQARGALADTRRTVAPEAALQTDLHETLQSVSRAADSVRVLADYLDKHPEALLRGKAAERP